MQAAYYTRNQTISLGASTPLAPKVGEVRVEVAYCGICGTDLHIYHGKMDARVAPEQIMGHEMAGTVAEVGEGVTDWHVGDHVVVRPLDPCGECPACRAGHSHICQNLKFLGIDTPGAFQGSWTVPAHTLHALPDTVGLDMGALVEPLAVACHDVRLAEVAKDEYVVVIGGGPIGMLIAMVAREQGAKVLISEINPHRLALAEDLGFATCNPLETDLVERVNAETGTAGADVVFEVTASQAGADIMTQLPRTRGRIVVVGIFGEPPRVNLFRFFWRELKLCGARVYEPEDFEKAIAFIAAGNLPLERIVTGRYPLADLEQALKDLESGADAMKVLIDTRG
jgi:2-desacetyl-2-hydroxyethyl bacteriochlorophyllide A dehydrogenase